VLDCEMAKSGQAGMEGVKSAVRYFAGKSIEF